MLIEDLTFDKAMATIDTIEKSRITQGKDATTVRKLDVQVNRVGASQDTSNGFLLSLRMTEPLQKSVSNLQKGPCGGSTQGLSPKEDDRREGEEDASKDRAKTKKEEASTQKSKLVRGILRVRKRGERAIQAIKVQN